DAPVHDGAVALLDAVAREGLAQPAPRALLGRDEEHARGVDVEAVDDAAAQAALADAVELGVPRDRGVQHRAALALVEGMHRRSRGLVDGEPAGPHREDGARRLGPGP